MSWTDKSSHCTVCLTPQCIGLMCKIQGLSSLSYDESHGVHFNTDCIKNSNHYVVYYQKFKALCIFSYHYHDISCTCKLLQLKNLIRKKTKDLRTFLNCYSILFASAPVSETHIVPHSSTSSVDCRIHSEGCGKNV